ncbi:hypothetical protein PRIC2_004164 [Phytophthora ramorum]
MPISRRSVGRVHSSFSLHTRVASVLAEDRQDAFDPNALIAKIWDQVLLSCLLSEAFLLPFFLAFEPTVMESVSVFFVLVNVCEIVFAVDLYVQAHTGYYSDGNLIRDTKRTTRSVVAKVLFLKLLRWSRFSHLVSRLDEFYAKHFAALKLLKVLASTLYLAHVLACVRFSFGDDDSHTNGWLPDRSTHSHALSTHYLMSLFWSVGIMTGLFEGDLPYHSSEFLFTILVALCGFSMFTTLCATIFVISKCESGNTEAMEARINQLVHVLSFHRVPDSQQIQAVEYLKVYRSQLLCADVVAFDDAVESMLLLGHDPGAMRDKLEEVMVENAKFILYGQGETVYRHGDYITGLYFLLEVPRQLHALETRYLKRTTELHFFKLFYYTFMLSHILGCMWFNFASRAAVPNYNSGSAEKETAFGDDAWLPSVKLEDGSQTLQYMASLYWSFGLMSSSGESDFPQTTSQSVFSVVTMTSGFFLFAYVIGNFGDIIELRSSESREFDVKMGAVRQMLHHFKMSKALQKRVKTFLLFKRYHTITREHILEHCLPPSLLTDIRLVFLKPMIEKVEFLRGMEASITRMLVSQFTQVLVSRGELIFKYGDSGSDMFFIFTGVLDVLLPMFSANPFKASAGVLENVPSSAGPRMDDISGSAKRPNVMNELRKVNEISDAQNPSSAQLALRLLRGLFFAVSTFIKKAYSPAPEIASLYAFHIVISFFGLITMSYVIGELASLFISHIGLEVGFRKNHIAVELYLARLRVSDHIRARTYAFMTSLWSSHAGVNYEELLAEMPRDIRAACVLHVSNKPLNWFVMKVATPICWEGDECIDALTLSLAERLRFESYSRDENVVTEGSIVRAMYFVIKGHLKMQSGSMLHRPLGLRDGSYFGERGLLGCTISVYTVRTLRACDLLSLSSEAFAQVLQKHPFSRLALKLCDRSYKRLKVQSLCACSRSDMEEHWGAAIQRTLQDIQTCHQKMVAATQARKKEEEAEKVVNDASPLNADFTAVSSFQANEKTAKADKSVVEPRMDASSERITHKGEMDDSGINRELGDLPAHIDDMFEALNTAPSCFEAFAPLLHILLPTDPLDWNTSCSASYTVKAREMPPEPTTQPSQQLQNSSPLAEPALNTE